MKYPSGAYRLLVFFWNSQTNLIQVNHKKNLVRIPSKAKLARMLSMEVWVLRKHLSWLEEFGYIVNLTYSEDRREVLFQLVLPIHFQIQKEPKSE